MSDTAQGEGWWQASDGKWYPPHQHPDARGAEAARSTQNLAPSEVSQPTPAAEGSPSVDLTIGGTLEMPRWRPLVQWALAIPVIIMGVFVQIIGLFGLVVAWFAILFTGRMPTMMHNLITLWIRFAHRFWAFFLGWTTDYPPLTISPGGPDDGAYPGVEVTMPGLQEQTSRLALLHWIMAIPHLIVLTLLAYAVIAVGLIAWFAVLFTGHYPAGMRTFMINVARWQLRVQAYVAMLYDPYPRFGF